MHERGVEIGARERREDIYRISAAGGQRPDGVVVSDAPQLSKPGQQRLQHRPTLSKAVSLVPDHHRPGAGHRADGPVAVRRQARRGGRGLRPGLPAAGQQDGEGDGENSAISRQDGELDWSALWQRPS